MNAITVNIEDIKHGDLVMTETGARLVVSSPEKMIGNPAQYLVQVMNANGQSSWDRFPTHSTQTLKYEF